MRTTTSTATTGDALHALRAEWSALHRRDPRATAYQAWSPQVRHWEMRADGSLPRVAVIRTGNAAAPGTCIAILPCARERRRHGLLRLTVLRPLAQPTWPVMAPLIDPEHADAALAALWQWLSSEAAAVDRVDLRFVRPGSWLDTSPPDGWRRLQTPVPTTRATFPPGVSEWSQLLSRDARRKVRKAQRRLEEATSATVVRADSSEAVAHWLSAFQRCHSERARALGRTPLFDIGTTALQFGGMLNEMIAEELAELHVLAAGERFLAGQITFRDPGLTHGYRRTFDPEFAAIAPGTVLAAAVIQQVLDRGDRAMDFGLGTDEYKSHWATDTDTTWQVTHARGSRVRLARAYTALSRLVARVRPSRTLASGAAT